MQQHWLGLNPYLETLAFTEALAAPAVVGSESPLCVTLGRRSLPEDQELRPRAAAATPVYHVDRGGHATLHNPGQLIIYPRLNLKAEGLSVRDYICRMGQVTVATLKTLGVEAQANFDLTVAEPGIYTAAGKIGFLGVRIQKGLTFHGLSLNVCNRLEDFAMIRSCSVWNQPMDSVKKQGIATSPEEVFRIWMGLWIAAFSLNNSGRFSLTPPACPSKLSPSYL